MRFRFLVRLLLLHGRWNYRRACMFTLFTPLSGNGRGAFEAEVLAEHGASADDCVPGCRPEPFKL